MLDRIRELTGAHTAQITERVQSLWSGYGEIVRVALTGAAVASVIVKRIAPPSPNASRHPRGWNTERSRTRKLRSYEVEANWYTTWAPRCGDSPRVPRCHGTDQVNGARFLVLEDLDASGFTARRTALRPTELDPCLHWLADLHANFVATPPAGLWPTGTYWHLATRPDELAALRDDRLRDAAPAFDAMLRGARFQTIVHGDAKVANFCFAGASADHAVAAVDFQYVGGGCGIQDVAYFLGSCLDADACARHADAALDGYFARLRATLAARQPHVDAGALEAEWRDLYAIAWADFVRFLAGWAPAGRHAKLDHYATRLTEEALARSRGWR